MKKMKMESTNVMTIREGYKEFKRFCESRNYSKYTIAHYDNTIHNFELFHNIDNKTDTLNQGLVEDYASYLLRKGLKGTTVATYICSLRTILYYLMQKEYIEPFKIIKPKYDRPIKEIYTDAELKLLLKKPNIKSCSFAEYRNWVLVNFLISTGQRKNTVLNLKIKDIDLENALMTLRVVKNRKPTVLPLATKITEVLREYIGYRKGDKESYLFCNITGGQMKDGCLTWAIKKYNLSRGVEQSSIHAFRHTYAKKYLLGGGNVYMLQKLMMHSDLSTTQQYLNLYIKDLQKDYELFNPLEQLINNNSKIKMNRD